MIETVSATRYVAPLREARSTVVQPGPVHGGRTRDPSAELDHLLDRLVR